MNDISLSRLCADCKNEIIIQESNLNEVILYDGLYYHKECFVNMCNKKLQSKRCKKYKWENALNNLNELSEDAQVYLKKEFDVEKKRRVKEAERKKKNEETEKKRKIASEKNSLEQKQAKDNIYNFMLDNYEVTSVPKYVFIKLNSIYSGTFSGMNSGILPTELLDMWERKLPYLNKIAHNNITKGKKMEQSQRISYDLSILINKYDSYKNWKRNQEILEQEQKEQGTDKPIVIGNIQNKNIKNNTDDISNLVDDIFG